MRKTKSDRNYAGIAVALFFGLIMATAVIGYIFGDNPQRTSKYNGIRFTLTEQGWQAKYGGNVYYFSFPPKNLEELTIPQEVNLDNLLEVDVTYDFNSTDKEQIANSIFEMQKVLNKRGIYLRQGFTTNTSFSLPIITCEDASYAVPVIYYMPSNESRITSTGNCIILESSRYSHSFLALTDRIAYELLGIM